MFEVYETKVRITADNDAEAEKVREAMKEKKVFLINLMGSPGAGKTSTLIRTINALKDDYRIGVMEADMDSDVDARTIEALGVKVARRTVAKYREELGIPSSSRRKKHL